MMKRPLIAALVIGLIAVVLVMGLHVSGMLSGAESAAADLLSGNGAATKFVSDKLQYVLVFVLAAGVALMVLLSTRRAHLSWVIALLLLEFVGLTWVCSLFRVLFQPLPSLGGGALGFLGAIGFVALAERQKSRPRAPAVVLPRPISAEPPAPIKGGGSAVAASAAQLYEVTAVVCDIANKHDLADECEPAVFAEMTEKFIGHAVKTFRAAGAYIESFGGEGVVAIFGFPANDPQHAEKATRTAMALSQSFADFTRSSKSEALSNAGTHAGVSSGTMVMAPAKTRGQASMLAIGEPVELARRFCIANRFYGSRVLLGPRTFELASKILVARPIDFLSGVDVRERHEIYEPVTLALEATPEVISRRDSFWNGVVLYREKRWAEAYTQFQNARGPNDHEDHPLQLYLRRLEPLALQLTETPLDV